MFSLWGEIPANLICKNKQISLMIMEGEEEGPKGEIAEQSHDLDEEVTHNSLCIS